MEILHLGIRNNNPYKLEFRSMIPCVLINSLIFPFTNLNGLILQLRQSMFKQGAIHGPEVCGSSVQ